MKFRGKYAFLSNFANVKIKHEGRIYNSVEHAYIASKQDTDYWKDLCLRFDASFLKKKSKGIDIRRDWKEVRLEIMYELLLQKFNKEPFKSLLLEIDEDIVEDNDWNDTFWGICKGKGENMLGKLLMRIRDNLKNNI